mgnify:CR=1 FL=1
MGKVDQYFIDALNKAYACTPDNKDAVYKFIMHREHIELHYWEKGYGKENESICVYSAFDIQEMHDFLDKRLFELTVAAYKKAISEQLLASRMQRHPNDKYCPPIILDIRHLNYLLNLLQGNEEILTYKTE